VFCHMYDPCYLVLSSSSNEFDINTSVESATPSKILMRDPGVPCLSMSSRFMHMRRHGSHDMCWAAVTWVTWAVEVHGTL
jgi:hypothetical protein